MKQDFIQFKQQRETGEIISVSFKFLRENYRSFFKMLFQNAGPAFVLLAAALAYYSYATIGTSFNTGIFSSGGFVISFMVLGLTLLLYFSVVYATIFNVIKSYIRNNGIIQEQEVTRGVRNDLGKMLGLNFISTILFFAGLMLFFIPGIYISVPLSIATAVLVFNQENITDSIGEAFDLVKNNWWMSFLSLLFIWLIVYVISLLFQLPLIIYTFLKAFTVAQEGSTADMNGIFDWGYMILMVISSLIQYLLYSIIPIGVAVVYFHLNEKKNFTGAYEAIENLGKNSQ